MTKELTQELLTVREAAGELGLSVPTVQRMVHRGEFRVYWPTPRKLWIYGDDVRARKANSVREARREAEVA